jgi:hypothetical protein
MEFALVLRELGRRRKWVGLGAVIAAIVAIVAVYQVGLFPPSLHQRSLQYSTASTQVYVDSPDSSLGDVGENLQPLVDRSNVLARVLASPTLLNLIGADAGIPGGEIYATGPIEPNLTRYVQEPSEGKRAFQVARETNPYRLEFDDDDIIPVIAIYSQAPTSSAAVRLANGAAKALSQYVSTLETGGGIPSRLRVTVRQLGVPTAAVGDSGITKKLGALIFVGVLLVWCGLILLVGRFIKSWQQSAQLEALRGELADADDGEHDLQPTRRHEGRRPLDPRRIWSPRALPVVEREATFAEEFEPAVDAGAERH